MKKFTPGGDLNPNSSVNVKPGFAPGEPGGAPVKNADAGGAPELTGGAKAAQRGRESGRDARMHGTPAGDGHTTSGMDRALSSHADKMHPVAKSQTAKRASPAANRFNDE